MDCELVTVGTELLLGFTVDTNSAEIGRALAAAGVRVVRRTAVSDDPAAIRDAVGTALARTGTVITTGGLGPTADDITKKSVADLFDAPSCSIPPCGPISRRASRGSAASRAPTTAARPRCRAARW